MFGIQNYETFVIAFVALLFLPGPGNLALIMSTGFGGMRGGMASVFGLLAGDQILLWLAIAGMATVLTLSTVVFKGIQLCGAAYLIWLGANMIWKRAELPIGLKISKENYFRQTCLITVLNPKAVIFYTAFFPQFIDLSIKPSFLTYLILALTVMILGFLYCLAVVLVTNYFTQRANLNDRFKNMLKLFTGFLLIGVGLRLVLTNHAISMPRVI